MNPLSYIVVRIRGPVDVKSEIGDTLDLLHLTRKFHATVVPDTPSYRGMIQKVKDYVAWGPSTPELVKDILTKRGRLSGSRHLTEEYLLEKSGLKSIGELAEAISSGRMALKDIEGLKPVFRLHPPRGGFKGPTKRSYKTGGELGLREDISSLIMRML